MVVDLRRLALLLGIPAEFLFEPFGHPINSRENVVRHMVGKQKQGTGEIPLPVDGDETPGDSVPTHRRLRAELFLYGYGISTKDHVPYRHAAVPRIEVDDLVERRDGIPERLQVAFSRDLLPPASPLEVVDDDV